jgi:hypothetical protein
LLLFEEVFSQPDFVKEFHLLLPLLLLRKLLWIVLVDKCLITEEFDALHPMMLTQQQQQIAHSVQLQILLLIAQFYARCQ